MVWAQACFVAPGRVHILGFRGQVLELRVNESRSGRQAFTFEGSGLGSEDRERPGLSALNPKP